MKAILYREVGENYRFFLKWRHAAFAGHLVIMGATLSVSMAVFEKARELAWTVPLFAAFVSLVFLFLDIRTSKVFQCAVAAGRDLEVDKVGYYTRQQEIGAVPNSDHSRGFLTHSTALILYYSGAAAFCIILAVLLSCP